MLTSTLLPLAVALSATASPILQARQSSDVNTTYPNVVRANWDGQCFYPEPTDDDFDLSEYLGRWYQVAGTVAPFTSGCKCIYAEYSLNANGTVGVSNGCQLTTNDQQITIEGTATVVDEDAGYGDEGVFRVLFPGQPEPECPGPNYIVQDINDADEDDGWAIVQASNFSTMFLLSRARNPDERRVERWLRRAGELGTNLTEVVRTNQTGCLFT